MPIRVGLYSKPFDFLVVYFVFCVVDHVLEFQVYSFSSSFVAVLLKCVWIVLFCNIYYYTCRRARWHRGGGRRWILDLPDIPVYPAAAAAGSTPLGAAAAEPRYLPYRSAREAVGLHCEDQRPGRN